MNFLAHIHIATVCSSDIAGNLLGDFVKGNPRGHYPDEIVKGILLHRFVDKYTDQHPISKRVKMFFAPHRRRFSPIAMDVFWDHCLANDWLKFSDEPLELFCDYAEQASRKNDIQLPERYMHVTNLMWKNRWLTSYLELDNIEFALERMSHRSARMAPLAECIIDIRANYPDIKELFGELYSDILLESRKKMPYLD